jgi:hypothetical protein
MKMELFLSKDEKLFLNDYFNIYSIISRFKTIPFLLIFNYDLLNYNERILLKKFLMLYKLTIFLCRNNAIKQTLDHSYNIKLKALLFNNTLLLYKNDKKIMDKQLLRQLFNHKQLCLLGGYWDLIFYRAKLFKILVTLKELNIKKKLIQNSMYIFYIIRCLSNKIQNFNINVK